MNDLVNYTLTLINNSSMNLEIFLTSANSTKQSIKEITKP